MRKIELDGKADELSNLLWVVVLAPFFGAIILAIFGALLTKKVAGAIGCACVGVSCAAALSLAGHFILTHSTHSIDTALYPWLSVVGLRVVMGLHLDQLSLVMMSVVTFVAFLIHLYAAQSMYDEDGYSRFFAYMNLFVGSMLVLVLSGNLLLLYLGWEGVGLCSYLLIGFWYKDRDNGRAAQKAFIVTRVGDAAFAVGLFALYRHFGTFDIQTILSAAPTMLPAAGAMVTTIAFLLLAGAVGKSAQLPLQTWLPDAMAGPTPVSALIHAATMVTAGVYLIARMYVIFQMAPVAQFAVGAIGALTLFYSGFSALVQRDIKRVLAYSTISQIGYTFLALGVGAYGYAIFHFVCHAFFKALLFLSAGVVIDALHHEHDLFKMGGLKNRLPVAYWTFLIGAASLSAVPLITAGFYSKDAIIWASYASPITRQWFWILALVGTFITASYSFRALFLAFYGEQKTEVVKLPGFLMKFSLVVLAFFSLTAGFLSIPDVLLNFEPFGRFIASDFVRLPVISLHANRTAETAFLAAGALECLFGIYMANLYFRRQRFAALVERSRFFSAIHRFFFVGWGFDWLYDWLFVRPYMAIAFANSRDFIDEFFKGLAALARYGNMVISATQTGRVRNYVAGLTIGAIIIGVIALLR